MRGPSGRARAAGFTLIEVLLAMAILGFITTIMWGSFSQTATNKRALEATQERVHTARVALMRMSRELEMAYLASETSPSAYTRTFLTASSQASVDEVSFSTFAHQRLRGGLAESDTSVVTYYGERDPDDPKITNLMRRETRRLQSEDPKLLAGEAYVLCPDVARVKLSFYDYSKKEWEREWNTHTIGTQYLPSHVRIALTVIDERGEEVTYSTDARIRVTETLGL
ncbi:MAG TPA: prepilin-type N-terminal cleavage/methylation domain-containing protein [Polyangia bacterium]|jgi:general secretion pathway protein J